MTFHGLGKKWFNVGKLVGLRHVLDFPSHSVGKEPICSAGTQVRSLGREEKDKAT